MSKQLTMAGLLSYGGGGKGPPPPSPPEPPKFNPFEFDGLTVRVILLSGVPWWVLADVCQVLEIGNPSMAASRLDDDEKGISTVDTLGGPQKTAIINESGLYSLILTSRKPEAKRFKKWITATVIPTIRQTGSYSFGQSLPPPPPPPPPLPRGPVVLAPDAMTALGGLVKNSAPRAVMQAIALVAHQNEEMKAALRHCGMMVPPEQVASVFWPMREVAKRESVAGKRIVQRMSMSMRNWCIEQGRQACVRKVSDIHGRTCLVFHIDAVDDWLADLRKQAGGHS
jgi:hypothetical protein